MKNYVIAAFAAAAAFVPAAANAKAYVQVQGGIDHVKVDGSSDNGASFGGAVGYEIPLGEKVFIGVEGSADFSTVKECADISLTEELCIKAGRDLSAVVRLGTNLSERTQLYVLGGYTNARIKASYDDGITKVTDGANLDGFRLGAGFKMNFSERFYGKLEYRYSNYEAGFSRHNGLVGIGIEL